MMKTKIKSTTKKINTPSSTKSKAASEKKVVEQKNKEATNNNKAKSVVTKKAAAKETATNKISKASVKPVTDTAEIKKILISQPKPTSEKSPYYDLASKYNLDLTFHQFIKVEGFSGKEFKKQGLDLNEYNGVILLSRNAIDHFFRICGEIKHKVSQELRYFCASESVALYLQKFIVYRKRKVFFSADGSPDGIVDVMMKFSDSKFLMPVSEFTKNEVTSKVLSKKLDLTETVLYRTVGNELNKFKATDYDLILFFSPFGVEVAINDLPDLQKKKIRVGTFGGTTTIAAEEAKLNLIIKAPTPQAPSMITAIDNYIKANKQK